MFVDPSALTPWWKSWSSGWYKNEYYTGLLMAGVILAIVLIRATIGMKTKASNQTQILNLCGQFLFLVGLWGLWQSLGYHALQPGYYAYPLWVPLAGVVASLIALRENKFTMTQLAVAGITTFCAFALPYSFEEYTVQIWKFLPQMPFIKVILLYTAIFFSVLILGQFRLGLYASIILLGISNPLSTELPQYYTRSKCSFGKDNQLVAIAAHKYLAKLDPTFSHIFIWTPSPTVENVTVSSCAEVPARYFADSIGFSGFVNLSPSTPYQPIMDIENGRFREIASLSHPVIVLVTTEPKHALQLWERLAVIGKQLGPPELVQFNNHSVSLPLYILR
jgi:hypothetical protein